MNTLNRTEMVKRVVTELGKDASLKEVTAQVMSDFPADDWSEKTIAQYFSASRKELGFTKPRVPKGEVVFSLDKESIKATKDFINSFRDSVDTENPVEDFIKILKFAKTIGLDKALQSAELLEIGSL